MNREADNQSPPGNFTQDRIAAEKGAQPKRKVLGLEDPYEHAPLRPDGDSWAILLKPELEADKIRCDAWKDEVQNLLIFAGLFSAVVTAFVIESYKFLQPDPNDAIIRLLFQISNGPNNASSSPLSISTVTSFVPTPSSVRINVFWFISLILSLATVLVGTIALQWLREHQSYPGLSPKESLAIVHMRSEALKAWYVPQIFTALPLLLQGALVLFFAGLIDFTLSLGTQLTIPVACVIGFILLFLAATTTLPAFQPLFFAYGRFSRDAVPTPCAFKSPQSQVFRTLFGFFLHLLSLSLPTIYRPAKNFDKHRNILPDDSGRRHLFPYIYTIWHRKTWPTFDVEWLSLRDAWHNRILDKGTGLYGHRREWEDAFPLSDITQCVVKAIAEPTNAKHTEEYLVAACYGFQDICTSVWNPKSRGNPYNRVDRRNGYFEEIREQHGYSRNSSISKVLIHGGTYNYDRFSDDPISVYDYIQEHHSLFYQDHVCLFLALLWKHHHASASPAFNRYQLEIKSRMMQYLLTRNIKPLTPVPNIHDFYFLHVFRVTEIERQSGFIHPSNLVNLIATIFKNVASSHDKQEQWINPLFTHRSMHPMLHSVFDMLAAGVIFYLQSVAANPRDHDTTGPVITNLQPLPDISEEYSAMFYSIAKWLDDEISSSEVATPSLLFDLSAIFLQCLLERLISRDLTVPKGENTGFSQGLAVLLDAVIRYKEQITGRSDGPVVTRSKGSGRLPKVSPARTLTGMSKSVEFVEIFSDRWWSIFFLNYEKSGLRGIEKGPIASSSASLNITPHPLASPNETHHPAPDIEPLSQLDISLYIRSESTKDVDVPSSGPASNPSVSHIPDVISDRL